MNQLFRATQAFFRNEDGVTAIEYALIAALIGVAAIGGATLLGGALNDMFSTIAGRLEG